MAPESLQKSLYSRHSDIYAFGICAFEIFCERKAFNNLDGFDLINAVVTLKKQPEFTKEDRTAGLKLLIKSCWDYEPENRPDSKLICKTLLNTLRNLKNN